MDRRDFFKKSVQAGLAVGTYLTVPGISGNLFARRSYEQLPNYDLVAVKGGEPEIMFDKAIETLGGMSNFVKKNQKVVVKPNIGWDASPERGADSNPKLIKRIVEHCYNAGAKEVYVFDHTCDNWMRCYSNSGIENAAKDAGAKVVPAHSESYYQEVNIDKGEILKSAKVHEVLLDCDVFINVPILKNHESTRLTISMKNLMGTIWDRGFWHRNDLNQCIADFAGFKKPDLNIVDAYSVMKTNGPRGISVSDLVNLKSQIISTDIVAADAAAAKLFGMDPDDVKHITIADKMGIGRKDLSSLKIKRIIL